MPKLDPVGFVENPDQVDIDPITIPICGLHFETRENVCEEFNFTPVASWGNTLAMIEAVESGEDKMAYSFVKWLRNALVGESEYERFAAFLSRPDVLIESSTLQGAITALREAWAARPTLPSSGSAGTGGSTKRTSTAASRARASRSRKSPSARRST
jgi:hypothetical protein